MFRIVPVGGCVPDDVLEDAGEAEAELLVETPDHGGGADIPQQHRPRLVGADVEYNVRLVLNITRDEPGDRGTNH